MTGYSPFLGAPWGNSLYTASASDAPGPPTLELPNSPMSPGGSGLLQLACYVGKCMWALMGNTA
jgi:hypothetical protein